MAGALRPVVLLMLLASVLFVVAAVLDGAYPGGSAWLAGPPAELGVLSWLYALVNAAVAIFVARGSERSLVARIALAAFFVLERPLSAFALGDLGGLSVATHLLTAAVEVFILVSALRVWRLGRSLRRNDLAAIFSVEIPDLAEADGPIAARRRPGPVALPLSTAWPIALATLVFVTLLAAGGVYEGFVPGGQAWSMREDAGWVVYVFAAVTLTIAGESLRGRRVALTSLVVVSLILFLERSFSPISIHQSDPLALALHGVAALSSLTVALAAAGAIQGQARVEPAALPTLEAA